MRKSPLLINIMTATLTPGDAIGNFILSCRRIFRQWGARVQLYADHVAPQLAGIAQQSHMYQARGDGLLWYHYSIYADNLELALASHEYKIMDYHGISPSHLFAGENQHMELLCRKGEERLPALHDGFDSYVVHSQYSQQQLIRLGFASQKIEVIPLCVDMTRFKNGADQALSRDLAKLDYLLFVGRIVPQKDILATLKIFACLLEHRPQMVLILVGSRQHAPKYGQRLEAFVAARGLTNRVLFLDQVNDPRQLAALFSHARAYVATSEWESFCVPVAESLFFAVPCIVHNVEPLPETAGPGGLVIDKNQPQDALSKIINLIENETAYRRLSQASRKWAQRYSDDALAGNLLTFFTKIFHLNGQR
jgi:L-malate glycosyltransferase